MKIIRGRLARNTLFTTGILGARMLVQAIGLLLIVRLFDPNVFGQLAAASTLAVLLGVLPTLGSGFVLMARASRDPDAFAHVWRYAWPMTLVIGLALTLAYLPLASIASGADALPLTVLAVLALTELLAMPLIGLASYALLAKERVPLSQTLQSLPYLLRAVALIPCFIIDPRVRIEAYVVLQFGAATLALLATMLTVRRILDLRGSPRMPTKVELVDGATYAGMHAVAANSTEIDKVLALRFVGAHDTGLYAAASRVLVALMMPINAMLLAALPRLFSHGHVPTLEGFLLVRRVAQLSAAWGIAAALLLMTASVFVPVLFGEAYGASGRLMFWMGFVAPFMALRFAASCVLVAIGKPMDRLVFELAGLVVIIVGIVALAPSLGPRGIVLAIGIGECVMLGIGTSMLLKRLGASVSSVGNRSS